MTVSLRQLPQFSLAFSLLLFGCSEPRTNALNRPAYPEPDIFLSIADSIGIEFGDSNFVFGAPSYACWLPDSNLLVVDQLNPRVLLYDRAECFITQVGRKGNGPGEYQSCSYASVLPSGGLAVTDNIQRKLLFYDECYQYTGCTDIFSPAAPGEAVFLDESTFIGVIPLAMEEEGSVKTGWSVSMFSSSSIEPEMTFFNNTIPFDYSNPMARENIKPLLAVSDDETIFISIRSDEEFKISAYSLQGDLLFNIEEPFSRVSKSETEIEEETERKRGFLRRAGMPESMIRTLNVQTFYNAIDFISIGPDGNLWVTLGYYDTPVFRIYDPEDGSYLYTAALENAESFINIAVVVNQWGFTALDIFSNSWPRVYTVEQQRQME